MDPNVTLEMIRRELSEPENVDGEIVAELFATLDVWMTRGGFAPSDWSALRR
jgi:hypothetical protein